MQQIYHKKNELFEVEFFADKKCTIPFEFTNAKDLYVELKDGDVTTLTAIHTTLIPCVRNEKFGLYKHPKIYVGYIASGLSFNEHYFKIMTLNDITPNISKYIPEDNAVLFLSKEDKSKFSVNEFSQNVFNRTPLVSQYWIDRGDFPRNLINGYFNDNNSTYTINGENKGVPPIYRKLTIFLPHGTQSELQKVNEFAKELKEKYGVKEVNLFALHWFGSEYQKNSFEIEYFCQDFGTLKNINKIITTNSTGILKPEDSNERLQVIDCKEIFEEYLKTER